VASALRLAPATYFEARDTVDNKYEMFLYIFSGVLLLLLLEQFLQIGIHMAAFMPRPQAHCGVMAMAPQGVMAMAPPGVISPFPGPPPSSWTHGW
jgi:hypothetical protein